MLCRAFFRGFFFLLRWYRTFRSTHYDRLRSMNMWIANHLWVILFATWYRHYLFFDCILHLLSSQTYVHALSHRRLNTSTRSVRIMWNSDIYDYETGRRYQWSDSAALSSRHSHDSRSHLLVERGRSALFSSLSFAVDQEQSGLPGCQKLPSSVTNAGGSTCTWKLESSYMFSVTVTESERIGRLGF